MSVSIQFGIRRSGSVLLEVGHLKMTMKKMILKNLKHQKSIKELKVSDRAMTLSWFDEYESTKNYLFQY